MPSQPFSFNIIFTIPQLFISQYVWKWLSSISFTFELMNRHSGINDDNNNDKKDRTKQATTTTAIPMVGAIVTAALLLSGLSLISSYQQPAIAQQNMTEGGAGGNATTAAGGGNATTAAGGGNQTTAEVLLHLDEVRTAIENDDDEAALILLVLAVMVLAGNGVIKGNLTIAATIAGIDATNTSNEDGVPNVGGTSA